MDVLYLAAATAFLALAGAAVLVVLAAWISQGALVFIGEDLDKLGTRGAPVVEQITGTFGARPAVVVFEQFLQLRFV